MIIQTNEFDVASAVYGILINSTIKENFWFESSNELVQQFNYLKVSDGGKYYNLSRIKDKRYNQVCWWEILAEAAKHMEKIEPDPTVNFAINSKVKSYFQYKYPNHTFAACNDLPKFRSETKIDTPYLVSSNSEVYKECKNALDAWKLGALEVITLESPTIEHIALAQSDNCKGYVGSSEDWIAIVSTAGYKFIEDLKRCKPFFFPELNPSFQQIPLSICSSHPIEYINFRYSIYQDMIKFNFNHIEYLRDKYGRKEEKGL